jgi:hypothetical protein
MTAHPSKYNRPACTAFVKRSLSTVLFLPYVEVLIMRALFVLSLVVVAKVLFFPRSRYITGASLDVNGGMV